MPLQPPIRIGVIGAGSFASRRHCPDIIEHPEAQLNALCRRDPEQLAKMADAFCVEHTYADYRELIDSGLVDAVLISSPHDLHYEHGKAALEKGLHVLLEKPITTDPQEGRKLVALAKEKGLVLIVAQNPPYWNHCRHLRAQFRSGRLGELESAAINWVGNALAVLGLEELPANMPGVVIPTLYRASAEQNGGGFTMDGGTHLLCELLWCTERKVVEVSAQMDNADFDVRCSLAMRLDNGALVSLNQVADSQVRAKRQHNIYYGSKGTAIVRGFPFTIEIEADGEVERLSEGELPDAPTPVGDFVDCVLGRSAGEISGDTAVHVVAVLRAAQEAARRNQTVLV
jgi:predicted dehydrogenase